MSKKLGIKIDEIVTLYNQGNTPAQIAERYGCCTSNITRRLKKVGIEFKRDYLKTRHNRNGRHKIDTDFFKCINTEEKAYFLGIMYSDGSVSDNQFYLKLKDEYASNDNRTIFTHSISMTELSVNNNEKLFTNGKRNVIKS